MATMSASSTISTASSRSSSARRGSTPSSSLAGVMRPFIESADRPGSNRVQAGSRTASDVAGWQPDRFANRTWSVHVGRYETKRGSVLRSPFFLRGSSSRGALAACISLYRRRGAISDASAMTATPAAVGFGILIASLTTIAALQHENRRRQRIAPGPERPRRPARAAQHEERGDGNPGKQHDRKARVGDSSRESHSTPLQTACATMAAPACLKRGCTRPAARKNTPSRAIAK